MLCSLRLVIAPTRVGGSRVILSGVVELVNACGDAVDCISRSYVDAALWAIHCGMYRYRCR